VSSVVIVEELKETFTRLYEEYMPKVFRYIHYRVGNRQLTEDLTSTVFEKALVNFKKYSREKASFSTWIFTVARNTVIDHYRTSGRRDATSLDEAIETPTRDLSPGEQLERKEEIEYLRVSLPDAQSRCTATPVDRGFGHGSDARHILLAWYT